MMDILGIHHIEFGVQNGLKYVQLLSKYNFRLISVRISQMAKQWLMCSNNSNSLRFLLTELKPSFVLRNHDPYIHPWFFPNSNSVNNLPNFESVFNIALHISNFDKCVERLKNLNVEFVKPVRKIIDSEGYVKVCTVRSCVGNVVHTLVDDCMYSGHFLPGFAFSCDICTFPDETENGNNSLIFSRNLQYVDHITFCLQNNYSDAVLWYQNHFEMKRLIINRNDIEEEGFVVAEEGVGVKIKALECRKEVEFDANHQIGTLAQAIKFVIVEPMSSSHGLNQVDIFLEQHGGAGIQHIGLYTDNIVKTIHCLQQNGVIFNEPPNTYYTEVGKLKEIVSLGVDLKLLKKYGILVDTELDNNDSDIYKHNEDSQTEPYKYLLQKFSRPLFSEDTFFLEVIQRVGATGFGSGNITALWRSMQAYIKGKLSSTVG